MKKVLRYTLVFIGLPLIVLCCVSATAGIASAPPIVKQTFTEPLNMLLVGCALIGFGSFIKSRTLR
jgi:energy-converting hydrogenase Eha subunit E